MLGAGSEFYGMLQPLLYTNAVWNTLFYRLAIMSLEYYVE